jgi:hypothetical protein
MTMHVSSDIGVLQAEKRFLGQTCWLMGSGPSLDEIDISLLKGKTVFAVNAAITLIANNTFKSPWWLFRDRRIVHQIGSRLDRWKRWGIFTHKAAFMTVKDVCGVKNKSMVAHLYDKEGVIHKRTIIEDALQIIKMLGFKQVNMVGVDHAVVENRPYAKALSWKECFFYDPKTPPKSGTSVALNSMMKAVEDLLPHLEGLKIVNTSPYYPKPIFEHAKFSELL